MLGQPTRQPAAILFCHQTVSPRLSKDKEGKQPGPHLDHLVDEVKKGETDMTGLPPLSVFALTDSETGEEHYFSLSNRKLYIAKKADAPVVNTRWASFAEISSSTWKMTNESGGYSYPKLTNHGDKAAQPAEHTLLFKFRHFLENRSKLIALNSPEDAAGQLDQLRGFAQQDFQLRCAP